MLLTKKWLVFNMDNRTAEQRKLNMQHIKQKDTGIEITLRKALWAAGYRYRKNYTKLPGKPDIVFTKYRICVFCDSEFWHGKDWDVNRDRMAKANNADFWIKKIERTIERDSEVNQRLRSMGWQVIRFWGNEIQKDTEGCVQTIKEAIFDSMISEGDI